MLTHYVDVMEGQRAVVYHSGGSGVVHRVLQRFSLSRLTWVLTSCSIMQSQ